MHCSQRRAWSALQLPLQLAEQAPVGALRDDLVGGRFDHAGFAQSQRIESDRVLDIVLPPLRVRDFLERLERIVSKSCQGRSTGSYALRHGPKRTETEPLHRT